MGLAPAVAAVRLAVRALLRDPPPGTGLGLPPGLPPHDAAAGCEPVVVACSGGADSLALLAGTVFEARKVSVPVLGATVDHGLQADSAARAAEVVDQMKRLGAADTVSVRVSVSPSGQGIEAAAREARYAALSKVAAEHGSRMVLLGHTRDDQAETVLLGLTRGSGGRSLAGMPASFDGLFFRPLLDVTREQTEAACRAEGIAFWSDPHNDDPRFTRSRIRHRVLPVLEAELGPGVAAALARTADMVRADVEALDRIAQQWFDEHQSSGRADSGSGIGPEGGSAGALERGSADALEQGGAGVALDVAELVALDEAIRLRVLRLAALAAGCPAGELFRVHLLHVDRLVRAYTGQQRIELPGRVHAVRDGRLLHFLRP